MAETNRKEKKGDMTVEEAGRMGGEKVAREKGPEFYSDIGQKGGEAPHPEGRGLQNADEETRRRVAHKGGQTVKDLVENGKGKEGGR